MHFWENHRFKTFVSGDLKGLPEHGPDYAQRMATPLFIFSKSKEGLATWTIWGVPTPPRSTNPLYYRLGTPRNEIAEFFDLNGFSPFTVGFFPVYPCFFVGCGSPDYDSRFKMPGGTLRW